MQLRNCAEVFLSCRRRSHGDGWGESLCLCCSGDSLEGYGMIPNLKGGGVIVNEFRVMRAQERDSLREGPRVRIHLPPGASLRTFGEVDPERETAGAGSKGVTLPVSISAPIAVTEATGSPNL